MSTEFAKNITLLRKERQISQKQAAAELGVSQALLSHYEKGVRECGLSFLVKIAEYYNVSCDYLLGTVTESNEDEFNADTDNCESRKKLLCGAFNSLLRTVKGCGNSRIENGVISALMMSIYRIVRTLCSGADSDIPEYSAKGLAGAVISVSEAETESLARGMEYFSENPAVSEKFMEQCESMIKALVSSER